MIVGIESFFLLKVFLGMFTLLNVFDKFQSITFLLFYPFLYYLVDLLFNLTITILPLHYHPNHHEHNDHSTERHQSIGINQQIRLLKLNPQINHSNNSQTYHINQMIDNYCKLMNHKRVLVRSVKDKKQ